MKPPVTYIYIYIHVYQTWHIPVLPLRLDIATSFLPCANVGLCPGTRNTNHVCVTSSPLSLLLGPFLISSRHLNNFICKTSPISTYKKNLSLDVIFFSKHLPFVFPLSGYRLRQINNAVLSVIVKQHVHLLITVYLRWLLFRVISMKPPFPFSTKVT